MGRFSTWFSGLSTGMKALLVIAGLVLFAALSPLIAPLAALFFILCLLVVAYRIIRQRPFRGPGILLLSSLVVLLVSSGVSSALYGNSTEQANSGRDSQAESDQGKARQQPKQEESKAESAPPETTAEVAKASPEKTAAAAQAKSKPEPKPKPKSKPKPAPAEKKDRSHYDKRVTVSRVIDGDTVEITPSVTGVEDVRLIGVDTPETVDPGEEVEPYGPEASAFATKELTAEKVGLEFDEEKIDQYDRLLAYVYTGDGEMFNMQLVKKGYAQAYPYPPNTKYEEEFAAAQEKARKADLGIWGLSHAQQCKLADRGNGIGEGTSGCKVSSQNHQDAGTGPGSTGSDLYNCSDFTTRAQAQAQLKPGDPYGLDSDGDGEACEDLPGSPPASASPSTSATASAQSPASPSASPPGGSSSPDPYGDWTCEEIGGGPYKVPPGSPHDADGDGLACE